MQLSGLLKFKNIGIRKIELVAKVQLFNQYIHDTVKPLITNTSEEFIKCRLDNFSMSLILIYRKFQYLQNK